jgi:hypothetical protein
MRNGQRALDPDCPPMNGRRLRRSHRPAAAGGRSSQPVAPSEWRSNDYAA